MGDHGPIQNLFKLFLTAFLPGADGVFADWGSAYARGLDVVRDKLGFLGEWYPGVADEVAATVIGQGHECVLGIAGSIRVSV